MLENAIGRRASQQRRHIGIVPECQDPGCPERTGKQALVSKPEGARLLGGPSLESVAVEAVDGNDAVCHGQNGLRKGWSVQISYSTVGLHPGWTSNTP